MANLPTLTELLRAAQGALRTALDPSGTGSVNLRAGSRLDALVSMGAAVFTRLATYTADRFAAARLDSATGEDLDVIARDQFNSPRKEAAATVGTVYLRRPGGTATVIPKGTRFAVPAAPGQPSITFNASADVTTFVVDAGDGLFIKARVAIKAAATGPTGDVQLSAITKILDPLPDAGWILYVPVAGDVVLAGGTVDVLGGGADRESDDILRARLRQLATDDSRQRATRRAILGGTLRVPGIQYATVVEPLDSTVVVYAGDASFGLPDALKRAIDTELLDWRALGVPVLPRKYNAVTVMVAATIYMARPLSNYDIAAITVAAISSVRKYFDEGRPQPDEYFLNAIESAFFRAHADVQNVVLTLPVATILRPADSGYGAVTALNRYRVTESSISVTIAAPQTT